MAVAGTAQASSKLKSSRGRGRPTKKTDKRVAQLMRAIATGAPYSICCAASGVHRDTFMAWKRDDASFAARVEEASAKTALRLLKKIEAHGKESFAPLAWLLERRFPEVFSRPEVQLNLTQQNNTTVNELSINITAAEVREIEAKAEPVRESVRKMLAAYRPALVNRETKVHEVETQAPVVRQDAEQALIRHKAGDEKRPAFWQLLVQSDPEKALVAKGTANFVCREILSEVLGSRSAGMKLEFSSDPVRLADVLEAIDRATGVSGWPLMQKKAGY